jgi:hypothetical protein
MSSKAQTSLDISHSETVRELNSFVSDFLAANPWGATVHVARPARSIPRRSL